MTTTNSTGSTASAPESPDAGRVRAGVLELDAVDDGLRPQDDLFRYANGSWLASAEIPADRPGTGSFTLLRDAAEEACHEILREAAASEDAARPRPATPAGKIGALFATFMDEERIEALGAAPLAPELDPVLEAPTKDALARALGAGAHFTGPVDAGVYNDINDPDRYTTWMDQAGLGLPDESYYREEGRRALRTAYVAHVSRMLELAGLPERLGAGAQELAERIMALETALAKGHWDRVACRDIDKTNNPMTWEQIVDSSPAFPWGAWREGVRAAAAAAGVERTTYLDETIVNQPDYLAHMADCWESASLEDLRAWACWHIVQSRATLLSSDFVAASFDFYGRTLQGTDELRPRWKRGVGLVESSLGEALGEIYVAEHFPPEHKAAMERLVADLIEAYRDSISSLEWMGPATRERALAKLDQFTPKIGYPDTWRDYSAVDITPGDLLASIRSVEAYENARALRKLGEPIDRAEWHMTPQTVNAYYNPAMNEIVFPAAILQPPFFDPGADDAVNYAGIGAVIGHEIGHGFDDQGSTFDGTGKVADWWTPEDRQAFSARTSALIAQYDALTPAAVAARHEEAGTPAGDIPHVNGALTIGENIGDLGGVGIALKAYRLALARAGIEGFEGAPVIDGLTGLQRFFYSWARIWRSKNRDDYAELLLTIDPHSPAEFRCNGIASNVDAFYEAFDVTPGDGMWLDPEQRVSIW